MSKVVSLQELGISKKSATKMISDYNAWLTRHEIIGSDNISDGIALVGHSIEYKIWIHH